MQMSRNDSCESLIRAFLNVSSQQRHVICIHHYLYTDAAPKNRTCLFSFPAHRRGRYVQGDHGSESLQPWFFFLHAEKSFASSTPGQSPYQAYPFSNLPEVEELKAANGLTG